jgi:DNA-binding NarL/FixJ family response regulator
VHTILLVDDDTHLLEVLSRAIQASQAGAFNVLQASTARAASEISKQTPISLAIVDLGLPDRSGVQLIEELRRRAIPAMAFTVFDGKQQVLDAVRAGAVGYLLKGEPLPRVLMHIQECLEGHMPVSSRVARYLFEYARPNPNDVQLTVRERDVLECLMRDCTYQECSEALGVSLGTVQTHIKNLYRKLDVTSRGDAVRWASRNRSA